MAALSGAMERRSVNCEVQRMGKGRLGRGVGQARAAALMVGLAVIATGCHAKRRSRDAAFSESEAQRGRFEGAKLSLDKVGIAGVTIASACGKESYVNARKGLIVAETGLHEDVFELRDRTSYKAVPFGLTEAQRLEALLQQEATDAGRSGYSADEAECIRQFAVHMQTLIEPLVSEDVTQTRLDISAFDTSSKEAQDEAEQEEKAIQQPAEKHP